MKLLSVRITNFQCIQDSHEFTVDDITCLVGKNESGKSALLQALYRLNPVVDLDESYNVEEDYPCEHYVEFESQIDNAEVDSTVVVAKFMLEDLDLQNIAKKLGENFLIDCEQILTVKKGYLGKIQYSGLKIDKDPESNFLTNMIDPELSKIDTSDWYYEDEFVDEFGSRKVVDMSDLDEISSYISSEQSGEYEELKRLLEIFDNDRYMEVLHETLDECLPRFMYFDEYYQMKGMENLNLLQERINYNNLLESDYPLLGVLELAGLQINQLLDADNTNSLITKLEAAAKKLTTKFADYWSQNEFIKIKFDIRPGLSGDPQGMNNGYNILGLVENTKSEFSTPLGSRSKGFIWFFSFLAWYEKIRKDYDDIILLLDEPGLSLHASAQSDLLNFFETELNHQIIYTTHSPFMINPSQFNGVRIVQNNSIEKENFYQSDEENGTKVSADALKAGKDTIFPLQGALGYEITQSLFIGPNCLIVEGVSDMLYLQSVSAFLQSQGFSGLSAKWTITPVGSISKVSTFVSLLRYQKDLNIAVLLDYSHKEANQIENLYKQKLLQKSNVINYSKFIDMEEATIEDLFYPSTYLTLINAVFGLSLKVDELSKSNKVRILDKLSKLANGNPRISDALSIKNGRFNHYRPAEYFMREFDCSSLKSKELTRFKQLFDLINELCN